MRKLITILLVILILAGIGTGGWFYIKANPLKIQQDIKDKDSIL